MKILLKLQEWKVCKFILTYMAQISATVVFFCVLIQSVCLKIKSRAVNKWYCCWKPTYYEIQWQISHVAWVINATGPAHHHLLIEHLSLLELVLKLNNFMTRLISKLSNKGKRSYVIFVKNNMWEIYFISISIIGFYFTIPSI